LNYELTIVLIFHQIYEKKLLKVFFMKSKFGIRNLKLGIKNLFEIDYMYVTNRNMIIYFSHFSYNLLSSEIMKKTFSCSI